MKKATAKMSKGKIDHSKMDHAKWAKCSLPLAHSSGLPNMQKKARLPTSR